MQNPMAAASAERMGLSDGTAYFQHAAAARPANLHSPLPPSLPGYLRPLLPPVPACSPTAGLSPTAGPSMSSRSFPAPLDSPPCPGPVPELPCPGRFSANADATDAAAMGFCKDTSFLCRMGRPFLPSSASFLRCCAIWIEASFSRLTSDITRWCMGRVLGSFAVVVHETGSFAVVMHGACMLGSLTRWCMGQVLGNFRTRWCMGRISWEVSNVSGSRSMVHGAEEVWSGDACWEV